jgi:hypothetical protein
MGTKDDRTYYQGIVWPDDRVSLDNIAAQGAGATDSSYTQEGARTGVPVADSATALSLSAGGSQSENGDQDVRVQRAGLPIDSGASFAWRDVDANGAASDWFGQDAPMVACDWEALSSAASAIYRVSHCDAVTLSTGTLLAFVQQATANGVLHFRAHTSAGSWASSTFTPQQNVAISGPALCALPDGSALLMVTSEGQDQVDTYRTTDEGTTWTLVSQRVLDTALTHGDTRRLAAAYNGGQILLLVCTYDSGGTYEGAQYVSSDEGATFQQVEGDFLATSSDEPRAFACVAVPGGGFAACWMDDAAADYRVARIATADENLAEADSASLGTFVASTEPSATMWADGSRALYALTLHDSGLGAAFPMLSRSVDLGATWSIISTLGNRDDQNYRLHSFGAGWLDGSLMVVSRFNSGGTGSYQNYSVCAARFGGYTTHTMPTQSGPSAYTESEFAGPAMWLPGVLPNNAWTLTTSGSPTVTNLADYLQIATTGGTNHYGITATDSVPTAMMWEGWVDVTSGGSTASDDVSVKLQWSDNSSFQYRITIRLTASQFLVYDELATANVGAATSYRTASGWHKLRVAVDTSDNIRTWYADQEYPVRWQEGPSGTLTDNATGASSVVEWGHRAAGTATSRWRGVSWLLGSAHRYTPSSSDSPAAAWTNPDDVRGRPLSYTPQHHYDGVTLSAQGGPGYEGDSWELKAIHDYAIEQTLPRVNPSPSSGWRSTADNAAETIVFDLESTGAGTEWGTTSVGCFLIGANVKEFYLEGYNGSSWVEIIHGEATEGFDGLAYLTSGRVVRPDTGTPNSADRYLHQNALVGDTWNYNEASPPTLRRVGKSWAGAWRDDTTARARIELDDIDGTEPASGTNAELWRQDFGGVAHNVTDYQLLRIRIPAHHTVDDYYKIGSIVLGPLAAFGTPYDLGYSAGVKFNDELLTSPAGRRRLHNLGPRRRSFEIAWANTAIDLQGIHAADPDPAYITLDGSTPLAARHDTSRQVQGIVEMSREDGVPIVVLPALEGAVSSQTIVGRERILYARPVSDVRIDNVLGYEDVSEAERLNTVAFDEEV